ncbi:MAG TPA: hypothetical protein VHL34_23230 [Rhizomicrobium sp.]|nr:hypothetical protein [Rhizomicrobium sp.]
MKPAKLLIAFAACLALFACKPQNNSDTGTGTGKHGGRHGALAACQEDIQKLCPSMTGKDRRKCLKQNSDKVSQGCKTAMEQRRAERKKRKEQKDQQGSSGE